MSKTNVMFLTFLIVGAVGIAVSAISTLIPAVAAAQWMDADQAKLFTMKAREKLETQCQKEEARNVEEMINSTVKDGECFFYFDSKCRGSFLKTHEADVLERRGFSVLDDDDILGRYRVSWCSE